MELFALVVHHGRLALVVKRIVGGGGRRGDGQTKGFHVKSRHPVQPTGSADLHNDADESVRIRCQLPLRSVKAFVSMCKWGATMSPLFVSARRAWYERHVQDHLAARFEGNRRSDTPDTRLFCLAIIVYSLLRGALRLTMKARDPVRDEAILKIAGRLRSNDPSLQCFNFDFLWDDEPWSVPQAQEILAVARQHHCHGDL